MSDGKWAAAPFPAAERDGEKWSMKRFSSYRKIRNKPPFLGNPHSLLKTHVFYFPGSSHSVLHSQPDRPLSYFEKPHSCILRK